MIPVNVSPGKAVLFIKFKTRWILTVPHLPRKMDMIIRSGTDQVMTQTFKKRKLSSVWSICIYHPYFAYIYIYKYHMYIIYISSIIHIIIFINRYLHIYIYIYLKYTHICYNYCFPRCLFRIPDIPSESPGAWHHERRTSNTPVLGGFALSGTVRIIPVDGSVVIGSRPFIGHFHGHLEGEQPYP